MGRDAVATNESDVNSRSAIGLTLLLFVAFCVVALRDPAPAGLWQDDGIYVATAQALAEGDGYRHIELPGEPLQTKYPILYPAVLAVATLVGPQYPDNLWLLLLPGALSGALLVGLSILYWRRSGGESGAVLICGSALAALSPVIWSHVRFCMSDLPFGALAMAALLALDRIDTPREVGPPSGSSGVKFAILGGVLIAAAMLTRGVGIALLASAMLVLAWRRRFAPLGAVIVAAGVLLIPWYIRQWIATGQNGSTQTAFLYQCELAYSAWMPEAPGQIGATVWQNLWRTVFGVGFFQLAAPRDFVIGALSQFGWRTIAVHLSFIGAAVCIVVGFVGHARRRIGVVHVFAALYGCLILAWPFDPYRFLIPWTPLLMLWLVSGVAGVARFAFMRFGPRSTNRATRVASAAVVGATVMVGAFFAVELFRITTSSRSDYYLREIQTDWTEYDALTKWVTDNTPPYSVIASAHPAGLFLSTSRQGHYFWPDHDPYRLSYGPDRSVASFYAAPAASEARFVQNEIRERLSDVYEAAGITHYIEHTGISDASGIMGASIRSRPDRFEPVYSTPNGEYTVFVFHNAASAGNRSLSKDTDS